MLIAAADNIAFMHGPQGSGKARMISKILAEKKRYARSSTCSTVPDASQPNTRD
jgi:pantothenate kinase-related protein Tda10